MSFAALLNKTCTIQSKTQSRNDYGETSDSWSTSSSSVPCRVVPAGKNTIVNEARMKYGITSHIIFIDASYTVDENYRIAVSGDQNYLVNFAKKESKGHHWELECVAENPVQ